MKNLTEYASENIRPIYEISDETLKAAIKKCRDQNTVLSRRRANELEKWLNSPKRQEIYALSGDKAHIAKFNKAKKEWFDTAIDAINNKDKNTAASNMKKFVTELDGLVHGKKFGKISLHDVYNEEVNNTWYDDSWGYYVNSKRGYNYYRYEGIDFSNFSRKRDGTIYNDYPSIAVCITLDNDKQNLEDHDYRQDFVAHFVLRFGKSKGLSIHMDMPYKSIPPEFEGDLDRMLKYLDELGIKNTITSKDSYIGKQSLDDKLDIKTIISNNFRAHIEKDSAQGALEKFCNALKKIDPDCTIEFGNATSSSEPSNYWVGASQTYRSKKSQKATLTFFGHKHELSVSGSGDMMDDIASIKFDDIEHAFYAHREYYDVGTWIGGGYKINDKVYDILEKDRKD